MALVLASQSPRRRQLMELITADFEVQVSQVDEHGITAPDPAALAGALAKAKCLAVSALRPGDTVIGSDTVVDCGGTVLGKPANEAEARQMLEMLSGRVHLVHTGVCLAKGQKTDVFVHTSKVEFFPLSREEIDAYVATKEPYDKAGGYGIQGGGALFCKGIDGDFFSIMGLPVSQLAKHLKAFEENCEE
ncbi:MAG: septum formation protein Maf [Oscillospiraceae bacterium]|nr:septum formation protein Maf [Oscillospiraceae bacterium]